jgi:hypothetical protein
MRASHGSDGGGDIVDAVVRCVLEDVDMDGCPAPLVRAGVGRAFELQLRAMEAMMTGLRSSPPGTNATLCRSLLFLLAFLTSILHAALFLSLSL